MRQRLWQRRQARWKIRGMVLEILIHGRQGETDNKTDRHRS
jgi:hypothetical protein